MILEEEMRRTLVFMEWKATWWEAHADVPQFTGAHAGGVSAYAHEQAFVWRSLKGVFQTQWARHPDGSFINPPGQRKHLPKDSRSKDVFIPEYFQWTNEGVLPTVAQEVSESEESDDAVQLEEVWEVDIHDGDNEEGAEDEEEEEEKNVQSDSSEDIDLEEVAVAGKYATLVDF